MSRFHLTATRDFEGSNYFDIFFIVAIATILTTRLYLHLTGYPQIGGGNLHIAHMLWGGLGMLVALIMLFLFVGKRIKYPASFIGGIGFGLFIDELGKFITKDNDYFFEPTVALIYLVFVAMFLAVRSVSSHYFSRPEDYLVNALGDMEEVAVGDLEPTERDQIRSYLSASPQDSPLTKALLQVLETSTVVPSRKPSWLLRVGQKIDALYRKAIARPHFSWVVVTIFVGAHAIKLITGLVVVFFTREPAKDSPTIYHVGDQARAISDLDTLDWVQLLSYVASTILVTLGVVLIFKHRLAAYEMFQRSILVGILVTQPFMFYRDQWSALIGLAVNILFYILTQAMIDEEKKTVATNAA